MDKEQEKDVYIFPSNYDIKEKFLGLVDYPTLIIVIAWAIMIYLGTKLLPFSQTIKLYTFMICVIPFSIFMIIGIGQEPLLKFISYIKKFLANAKIYVYDKE
jgi:type II secretory pathway component PulF